MTTATDEMTTTSLEEAQAVVKKYMYWSLGAGAIPFPIVDIVGIMGVHLKMVRELATLYDVDYSEQRLKPIISSLVSSLSAKALATYALTSVLKALPGPGSLLAIASQPISAAALNYALGKVFIQHFEAGGTLLDFDAGSVKELFRDKFEEGRKKASKMKNKKAETDDCETEADAEVEPPAARKKPAASKSKSSSKTSAKK